MIIVDVTHVLNNIIIISSIIISSTVKVTHTLEEESPLFNFTPGQLLKAKMELIVCLEVKQDPDHDGTFRCVFQHLWALTHSLLCMFFWIPYPNKINKISGPNMSLYPSKSL